MKNTNKILIVLLVLMTLLSFSLFIWQYTAHESHNIRNSVMFEQVLDDQDSIKTLNREKEILIKEVKRLKDSLELE